MGEDTDTDSEEKYKQQKKNLNYNVQWSQFGNTADCFLTTHFRTVQNRNIF